MSEFKLLRLWCILLALCLAEPALAAGPSPKNLAALLAQVEEHYAQMQSLECQFSQKSRAGGRMRTGRGKAIFFRPTDGKGSVIRWEYWAPAVQLIVNDGKEIRMYTPADNQLLISPAGELDSDMAYALFTGKSSLASTFQVASGDSEFRLSAPPEGTQALLLTPKTAQSQLKRAQVWINRDKRIERILMEDHFESLTELNFSEMRFDVIAPDDTERIENLRALKTPAGVQVIRQ